MVMERIHIPVMLKEVVEFMRVFKGGHYFDLTFGEGGHSEEILKLGGEVLAIDRDYSAIEKYKNYGLYKNNEKLTLIHGKFSKWDPLNKKFDGGIIDLGVSTTQLLDKERGFSFYHEGPLDMRMDRTQKLTLRDLLSNISETKLSEALFLYGNVRNARKISKKILSSFHKGKIKVTTDLAALFPRKGMARHGATKIFMVLRMLVNDEIDELVTVLPKAINSLKLGTRLIVISFNSFEDRIVKQTFLKFSRQTDASSLVKIITKKPLTPSNEEIKLNPRARSAKLRCVEKI